MGIEWQLLRKDNKTIFNLSKRLGAEILDVVFSQEQLLEFLIIWQLQFWERHADVVSMFILRDRLLDFTEDATQKDLTVVSDSWFHTELPGTVIEYIITHDRFIAKDDIDKYYNLLSHTHLEEYTNNPLTFFRVSQITKGMYVETHRTRTENYCCGKC